MKTLTNQFFYTTAKKLETAEYDYGCVYFLPNNCCDVDLTYMSILFISFPWNAPENRRRKSSCVETYGIFLHVLDMFDSVR